MRRFGVGVSMVLIGAWLAWAGPAVAAEVEVGQVVVTATKTEVEISEAPQSISVITKEEIQNTPDRSIGEIIQRAPAILITQYGPLGSLATPQVRGSASGQVLILVNGRRINNAQNGQYDLSNLPIPREDIERIEILRGGASVLYGADALGGVINIITKAASDKPSTQVSGSWGRFDTGQFSLVHRWKPGRFSYGVSLAREVSDGYRLNSDYDAWILGGEVGYELASQNEVRFSARHIKKEVGLPGPTNYPDPDDRQEDGNTLLDLSYQGKITPALKLNFSGWYNHYRNAFNSGTRGLLSFGTSSLNKSSQNGAELQATYQLGEIHLLVAGVEAIQDRVNGSSIGVHRATRGALYVQDEIEIGKVLTTTLGLRYDYHSDYDDQLNPRLGLLLRLPAEVRVRASVGRSFRAPTFNDLYWPATPWESGNPNLKPETAWNYELGVEKKFDQWIALKIAGFYREVKDLIEWKEVRPFVWQPNNVADAQIWGGEAELVFYPAKGWAVPLNYSYLDPRNKATKEPIYNRAKHILNAGIDYRTPFGLKGSVKGRYVQFYVNPVSSLNREYYVLDLRVGYEFKIVGYGQGEAFLSLTNALDKEYQISGGYPMPPRALTGGVNFAF